MSHPQVDDAAVIGVVDVEWGEEVRALVVLRPPNAGEPEVDESALQDFCQERLSSFKRPRSVVFVDDLPSLME